MLIALHEAATQRAQARFSPCRIQIPPIRTIKTPMRLLITRITALNVRLIAHLETKRSVSTCCGSTSKTSEPFQPFIACAGDHLHALFRVGRDDDGIRGSNHVAMLLPQTLKEVKAALEAREAMWAAMRKATPDAPQVA